MKYSKPVNSRADSKLRAESPVEIRYIAKPALQCDVENFPGLGSQTQSRPSQPNTQKILMRRRARDAFKRAQKMIRTQSRHPGKAREIAAVIGVAIEIVLNHPYHPGYPRK